MPKIEENILLAGLTTMRVGGPARYFCRVETLSDAREALDWVNKNNQKLLVLGAGGNLIIDDNGFDGLVMVIENRELKIDENRTALSAGAGYKLSELMDMIIPKGWQGLEWAGGLPGTLGGSIRGNAGAFGGEICNIIQSVEAIDMTSGKLTQHSREDCQFGYRASRFKKGHQIIWSATLRFKQGDVRELLQKRDSCIEYRRINHPQEPSAGCMFKNLFINELQKDFFEKFPEMAIKVKGEKLAAGTLLEMAELKGERIGGAEVSVKHANIIINSGSATAIEIRALANLMKQKVMEKFDIELQEEPEFIGVTK